MAAKNTHGGPGQGMASQGPAVTGISPASGPTAGGIGVTVTGSGFTGVIEVRFGSEPGLDLVPAGDSQLTVTSPPAAVTGPVDVTVTTPAGTSGPSAADQFSYVATGLTFLSWYRTGLSAAIQPPATGAPLGTPPPASVAPVATEVPRAFRTVHPIGWTIWKGEVFASTEEELLAGIQG